MAGRFDIQRFPVGLLELLGMKGTGDTPHTLGDNIGASVDIMSMYLAQRRVTVSAQTSIAMTGNGTFNATGLAVPSGEIWFVYNVSVRLTPNTAVATAIRFWAAFVRPSASGVYHPLTDVVSVGAGDNGVGVTIFEQPAIFLPGDQFTVNTGAVTGVPGSNGLVALDVARLTL